MKRSITSPIMFFSALLLLSTQIIYGQDTTKKVVVKPQPRTITIAPPQVMDKTLSGQYRALLSKLYNYQQASASTFYKSVNDTLRAERAELRKAKATVASQAATIRKLNVDAGIKDELISSSQSKMDEIKFLGMSFSKAGYNTLMWGLVIGFAAALVIVIITTARFKQEAKYRIKLYDELSAEFQTYKTKANDKEKKLARELQTERNKLDELLGR